MEHEYRIQYSDGSEVGPFTEIQIASMRSSGEIPDGSTIVEIENHDVRQAFYEALGSLFVSGASYHEINREDLNEIERNYLRLVKIGPTKWSEADLATFRLINEFPGRRDALGDPALLRMTGTLSEISNKLDHLSELVTCMTNLLGALTDPRMPRHVVAQRNPNSGLSPAITTAAAAYGLRELHEINDNLSDISDSLQ